MNDSFVFYKSFFEAASELDADDRLAFYDAIAEYAITGEEPEIDSKVARAVFKMARPQIDANEKRRENGKKGAEYGALGGRPKKENPIGVIDENPTGVFDETPNANVNANANANANGEEKRETRMARPSVDDVKAYCAERGNSIDAQGFVDFYEAKGWMVGNQPMKDWKACVRTWERREKPPNSQPARRNRFVHEQRHAYDFDALERDLLSRPVGGAP